MWRSEPGPPDFVGAGAIGAGYEWWHDALIAHPQIRGPRGRRRNLAFFAPFCARPMTDEDVAGYHAAFPRAAGTLRGEWGASYLHQAWVPPLLARAAPEAKVLVMLRDPVACYRETFAERRRLAGAGARRVWMNNAVERRAYASQLKRLEAFVPRERILVLQYERCVRDPETEYRRTVRFLGASDDFAPELGTRETRGPALWPEIEAALAVALAPELARLASERPELDLTLWAAAER